MTSAPKFLIWDSNSESTSEDGTPVYCTWKNAHVQWPPSVQRGRPKKASSSSKAPKQHLDERYEFIYCPRGQRPNDPNTQKFIRSHVMHNFALQQAPGSSQAAIHDTTVKSCYNYLEMITRLENHDKLSPQCWGSDPFNSFPMEMQPHMHSLLSLWALKFAEAVITVMSAVAEHAYPIEMYWGFNPMKEYWVPLALNDSALLKTILFCSDQFEAKLSGDKERPSAIHYLEQAIRILQERLNDPFQEISDSTIAAVATLALVEQVNGFLPNWRTHMEGIRGMINMRGGLLAFECNHVLYDKLCRADIWGSVYGLSSPYLPRKTNNSGTVQLRSREETRASLPAGFQVVCDEFGFDTDLADALCEVTAVTLTMNIVNPTNSEAVPLSLRNKIRSVQYKFLFDGNDNYLEGISAGNLKACRLGVLLFLGIIQNEFFWVSGMSRRLVEELKSFLERETPTTYSMRALRFWLLFLMGSLILDQAERSWLVVSIAQAIPQLSLLDWPNAKLLLRTFVWVERVQDQSGRDLWDEARKIR